MQISNLDIISSNSDQAISEMALFLPGVLFGTLAPQATASEAGGHAEVISNTYYITKPSARTS
jgi:hypothetical protein